MAERSLISGRKEISAFGHKFRFRKKPLYLLRLLGYSDVYVHQACADYGGRAREMTAIEAPPSSRDEGTTAQASPVLAVVNRKGGAGKTSATHNIAGVWGTWGLRVCLVDLDTAFNLTEACGYPEELR